MSIELFRALFFVLLVAGAPIWLVMGFPGFLYFLFSGNSAFLFGLPGRIFDGLDSFILTAIPFFLLAGELMNRSGMSERLVAFADLLVGRLRGGLAQVNVASSLLFAGITGVAVGDVASLGKIFIPRDGAAGLFARLCGGGDGRFVADRTDHSAQRAGDLLCVGHGCVGGGAVRRGADPRHVDGAGLRELSLELLPFLALIFLVVIAVGFVPGLTLWVPTELGLIR